MAQANLTVVAAPDERAVLEAFRSLDEPGGPDPELVRRAATRVATGMAP